MILLFLALRSFKQAQLSAWESFFPQICQQFWIKTFQNFLNFSQRTICSSERVLQMLKFPSMIFSPLMEVFLLILFLKTLFICSSLAACYSCTEFIQMEIHSLFVQIHYYNVEEYIFHLFESYKSLKQHNIQKDGDYF